MDEKPAEPADARPPSRSGAGSNVGALARRVVQSPFSAIGVTMVGTAFALWQGCVTQRELEQTRMEFRRTDVQEQYQALEGAILTVGRFQRVLGDCLRQATAAKQCDEVLNGLREEARVGALDAKLAIHYPDIHEWMSDLYLNAEEREVDGAVRDLALLRKLLDRAEDHLRGPGRVTDEGLRGPPRMRRFRDALSAGNLRVSKRIYDLFVAEGTTARPTAPTAPDPSPAAAPAP